MDKKEVSSKENVAKRLVWLRKYFELSQIDFAEAIGVSPPRLNNWERGRQRLSLEAALRINSVFGTTLDFLYLDRRDGLSIDMVRDLSLSAADKDPEQPEGA